MQLRDRAEGAGAALHGSAGNQGRREEISNALRFKCPRCFARRGRKCITWTSAKSCMEWDAIVHVERARLAANAVIARLQGK